MRLKAILALLCTTACFTLNTVNVGQKTSLEKQLMGDVTPLSDEELLAASVRAGPAVTEAALLAMQENALRARERQLFNRDDIRSLKTQGCLGEGLQAQLKARPCSGDKTANSQVKTLRDRLVYEENADRTTLIAWARGLSTQASSENDIVIAYHRLLLESALPGDAVEQDNGAWTTR